MLRFWFGLTLLLLGGPVVAAPFTALSVRELVYQADVVVAAVPADRMQPGRCKVVQQFKGNGDLTGQEIVVEGLEPFFPVEGALAWRQVRQVCLFLAVDGRAFRLVPTGVRCKAQDDLLWRPLSSGQPAAFHLAAQVPSAWDSLLRRLETEVPAVKRLQFLRDLPPGSRRNQALLDWIEGQRLQFETTGSSSGSMKSGPPPAELPGEVQDRRERGWGDLEELPFLWLLESGSLPECWRAIQLHAEIHSGECLGLDRPLFCSPAGRAFLLRLALDEGQLEGQRRRALRLLASPATLRGKSKRTPTLSAVPLAGREQGEVLEQLKPLLQARAPLLRAESASAVLEVSRPLTGMEPFERRLLPALVQAYKAEKPGRARDALAEAVRLVGGEQHWQELIGQKHGLAGYVQDLHARGDLLFFWLLLRSRDLRVHEVPTLVLERLDKDGKVVEKKTHPLPVTQLSPGLWTMGWDGSLPLYVQQPVTALELGTWRLGVEGTAGKERMRWLSEPRLFQVVSIEKPGELRPVNPPMPVRRVAVVEVED